MFLGIYLLAFAALALHAPAAVWQPGTGAFIFVLGWVGGTQGEEAMHFAEFGVVIMLFMIGLELEPARLWRMRGPIFGLGGLQVSCTALAVMAAAMAFGLDAKPALAAGMILENGRAHV